jgi:hypothetical protein
MFLSILGLLFIFDFGRPCRQSMNQYGVLMKSAPTLQEGGRICQNELAENFSKWASLIWLIPCKSLKNNRKERRKILMQLNV